MNRINILPIDIMNSFGVCYKTARQKLQTIKDAYQKKKHQTISVNEFCKYYDIKDIADIEAIKQRMK